MTQGRVVHSASNASHGSPIYQPYPNPMEASKSWHPKLTPYRFVVLATTIGLGTAKAIVTQNGGAVVSTTLEWVAGTFLSLIFFVLSAYDSRENVPSYLIWLFKPDCMDFVWWLLALLSIERPEYISDEVPSDSTAHSMSSNPDITPYRILVCGMVTAFGISKATLSYSNQSTPATWTDWAIAVPVTSLLYVLSLYEYNSSNVFPGLFFRDQSEIIYSVNRGMMYSMGILLSSVWTAGWAYLLYRFSTDPLWDFVGMPEDGSTVTLRDYVEYWQALFFKFWLQECLVAPIGLGALSLYPLLRPTLYDIRARSGVVRRLFRAIRRPILKALRPVLHSTVDDPLSISEHASEVIHNVWERTKPFLRVAFHLALHVSGIIFMLTFSMISILSCIITIFQHSWKDAIAYFLVPMWALFGLSLPLVAYEIGVSMIAKLPPVTISYSR